MTNLPLHSLEPILQALPLALILSIQRSDPDNVPAADPPDLTDLKTEAPAPGATTRPAMITHFEGYNHGGLND